MKLPQTPLDYDELLRQLAYPAEQTKSRSFSLEPVFFDYLLHIGGGNASRGMRVAIRDSIRLRAKEIGH